MARQNLNLIDTEALNSAQGVVNSLENLDAELDGLGLSQFKLFNKTYSLVTDAIRQALDENYFKNPEFIEKLVITFAVYYFRAVNDSYAKNPDLPLPWAKLNEYATLKSAPVFMSLMLGANAHINYDLPRALNDLMPAKHTDELLEDLAKMDKLLMKSGKEAIHVFTEKNKFYDFLKRRLQFTYYRPAMHTILHWRRNAWKRYVMLRNHQASSQTISYKSTRTADKLLRIAKLLG